VRRSRTATLEILTPEGVKFALPLAGPVARFLAWVVDFCVFVVAVSLVTQAAGLLGTIDRDLAGTISIIALFALYIGGSMLQEWYWRGQTLGKRVFHLRVTDAQGLRLQSSQIFMRNVLRLFDMLPVFYLVGGVTCALSAKRQRLGDIAANTVVIRTPQISEPDLQSLLRSKYNSLAAHPHLAARLRQLTSPALSNVALEAILRRDQFTAEARLAVFADIAEALKKLVAFPEEAVEALPDEQYVRNAVEILRIS